MSDPIEYPEWSTAEIVGEPMTQEQANTIWRQIEDATAQAKRREMRVVP